MLRQDDYIKSHLVSIGYTYGKEYGGHLAACMVMSTLANRVRLGWGSWLEVMDRIPYYSAEINPPKIIMPSIWEPNFIRLLHEVEGIYDSSGKDLSKGAVYWCDLRRVETEFFKTKILGNKEVHMKVADMNSFAFFM